MPSIFSRPFLGHKAIFLTCVGYAKIDVMCCCCALMYMCLSCVDIGQLLAFLGCLVYQHIQTHYIYMFDCHGSVPDSWHMGETMGMRRRYSKLTASCKFQQFVILFHNIFERSSFIFSKTYLLVYNSHCCLGHLTFTTHSPQGITVVGSQNVSSKLHSPIF